VSVRVSRARAVVARGRRPAVAARVAGISRQAIYRPVSTRPAAAGPGKGRPGDDAIVEVAKANPTDGTRMVAAIASRELGEAVNRKRAQRVMRAHRLLQPTRGNDRRRRPGFFRVTRPDELWHMDMTKVWTAAHGWVYLHVIVDISPASTASTNRVFSSGGNALGRGIRNLQGQIKLRPEPHFLKRDRHLPPPTPLRDRLPNPRRGRRDLAQNAGPTNRRDLNRQRRRGPRQPACVSSPTSVRCVTAARRRRPRDRRTNVRPGAATPAVLSRAIASSP
jgi:hypothetical protein